MANKTELEKALDDLAKAQGETAALALKVSGLETDLTKAQADLRSRERDLTDARSDLTREVAKNADPEEELLKSMSGPAKDAYLAQKALNEKLTKRLEKDDADRALAAIAKGIETDMPGLPIKSDEFAPILKVAKESLTDEQSEELNRVLKAGAKALVDLNKLSGLSNGGHAPTSAEDKIEKLAKERAAKDNSSFEKAYASVLNENPELYADYESERGLAQ